MTIVGTYWGPLFPDRVARQFATPATYAELSLAPTVTNSGILDYVILRARAEGSEGNDITIEFSDDASTALGEFIEDVDAKTIHFKYVGEQTTLFLMEVWFHRSALVQMVGTWDPLGVLATADDAFEPINLAGGAPALVRRVNYWGPLFPDSQHTSIDPSLIVPVGPAGAATFAMAPEAGFEVEYEWSTNVFKARDGRERRASRKAAPSATYTGDVYLLDNDVTRIRGYLQRFAAQGATFLLGIAHESVVLTEDVSEDAVVRDVTMEVGDTEALDWAVPGQRTAIIDTDGRVVQYAVVQEADAGSITASIETDIDIELGRGCDVIPLLPVILDPRQGFSRIASDQNIERWRIVARGTGFGFRSGNIPARLDLGPTLTDSGSLHDVVFVMRQPGAAGNGFTIELVGDSPFRDCFIEILATAGVEVGLLIHFKPDVCTVEDLHDAMETQKLVAMTGEWNDHNFIFGGLDEFAATPMAGGANEGPVTVGGGAVLTDYASHPVFDRGICGDTGTDSLHSLTEVLDLGEAPVAMGTASESEWGRQVSLTDDRALEWQWLKLFLWTVRGRWKAFWLPTARRDLEPVSEISGGGTTVTIDAEVDDFFVWWPDFRQHIVVRVDEVDYYVQITAAVIVGEGHTLTLAGDMLPPDGPVDSISWLELCRFESDQMSISWRSSTFEFSAQARAVRR